MYSVTGGEGEVGKILKQLTWNKGGNRGGVQVKWKSDSSTKEYRVGGEGCVDVIYTRMKETASGGKYYADHLPLVGKLLCGRDVETGGKYYTDHLPLVGKLLCGRDVETGGKYYTDHLPLVGKLLCGRDVETASGGKYYADHLPLVGKLLCGRDVETGGKYYTDHLPLVGKLLCGRDVGVGWEILHGSSASGW